MDEEFFWRNRAVEAVEASEVAEADEVNEAAKVSKGSKITTEDFRVIQVLEFSFILMFSKKNVLVESWTIRLNFSTFSVGGCWGQLMLLCWKLVDETQMSNPRDHAARDISSKKLHKLLIQKIIYTRNIILIIKLIRILFTNKVQIFWFFQVLTFLYLFKNT